MSELERYIENANNLIKDKGYSYEYADALFKASMLARNNGDIGLALKASGDAKYWIDDALGQKTGSDIWGVERWLRDTEKTLPDMDLYYSILKQESFDSFESFIYYMERPREYKKRFYQPRKCTLKTVVQDFQDLEDDVIKRLAISMPSRTGKSTTFLMFLAWIGMKRPNSHSAYGGHSGILAKGSYKEIMNFLTTPEYAYWELYNYWHSNLDFIQDKSADEFTVNLGDPDRFPTLCFRGIDGTWTGAVDVSGGDDNVGYLCVDDLVRDREHSLSPIRMENTYQEYQNKMLDRMNDGAKLCLIGTLWNVLDPIERERQKHEHDPRWRFRKIPALDENDESNFQYEINGFSTQYYKEMRDRLEPAEWMAKYQQQPFVREGLLFTKDRFRWFNGFTPDNERKVMAVCDPAFGGHDKLSMPILYIDIPTQDKYIIDWVYKSGTQNVTVPMIVRAIIRHYITELHIEQNSGGKLITDSIEKEMKAQGVTHCKIIRYYASTKIPKEERIKAYSDFVLDNFQFLMENQYLSEEAPYRRTEMYDQAVGEMNMYTSEGKNSWDDGCDSITKMAEILGHSSNGKVDVIDNPFKYGVGGYY